MATRSQAEAHRRNLKLLVRQAHLDLRILFDRHRDADRLRDSLLESLPLMVDLYGAAAGTLAADWYDDLRDEEEVGGRYRAAPAELPDAGRAETLARWGVGALYVAGDLAAAYSNTAGGLQRIIADADRQTITQSSTEDARSPGWERSTSGGCEWCESLSGAHSGPDFGSHDHCGCIAVPRFG